MMEKVIMIGFGGHAKSVVDIIEKQGQYEIAGFVDKDKLGASYRGYSVIGTDEDLPDFYEKGIRYAVMGIGYMGKGNLRQLLYEKLKAIGYEFPVLVDPSAVLADDVQLEEGVVVGKCAVLNSNVTVGKLSIINTGAIVEHECRIGEFSHVAVGAVLCGASGIGNASFVGANATVLQECTIGNRVTVGAGAVVTTSGFDKCTIVGVPAKEI